MRGAPGAAGTGVSMVAGVATLVDGLASVLARGLGAGFGLLLSRKLATMLRQYSSAESSLCDDDSSELLGGLTAAPPPAPAAARGTPPPLLELARRELDVLALARRAPKAALNALMDAC